MRQINIDPACFNGQASKNVNNQARQIQNEQYQNCGFNLGDIFPSNHNPVFGNVYNQNNCMVPQMIDGNGQYIGEQNIPAYWPQRSHFDG